MADLLSFVSNPVLPGHAESPLAGHLRKGEYGALPDDEVGVVLTERFPLAIADVASWPGAEAEARAAIRKPLGKILKPAPGHGTVGKTASAYNIAPGRWLVSGTRSGLVADLNEAVGASGTVTDLSHGRTVIRIDGSQSRWLLSKIFAVDFADPALPLGHGLATAHHDIHASLQRVGPNAFDVYVFRSFARSFWHLLCRSAEETGYRVT